MQTVSYPKQREMILKKVVVKSRGKAIAKATVEELAGGFHIATFWDMSDSVEADRETFEFETYSAALACMYERALRFVASSAAVTLED